MYYFTYDLGEFYVVREFNDSDDFEIVDIVPFYDVGKICDWCECADMKFPYEITDLYRILSKIDSDDACWNGIDHHLSSFHIYVTNGDIKLYCKEKRK